MYSHYTTSVKLMIIGSLHESNIACTNTSQKFRNGFLAVSASNTEVEELGAALRDQLEYNLFHCF